MDDPRTEEILSLAEEIGIMLTRTAEYLQFVKSREEALSSDEAELFTEYTEKSSEITRYLRQGMELDPEELRAFASLREKACASARVKAFIDSAEKYADLLELIRKTVAEQTA